MPCSSEPLNRVAKHNLTFQQLYSELEAALPVDKEKKLALLRDRAHLGNKSVNADNTSGILYTGQGGYYNNSKFCRGRRSPRAPRFTSRSEKRNVSKSGKNTANRLSISGCLTVVETIS